MRVKPLGYCVVTIACTTIGVCLTTQISGCRAKQTPTDGERSVDVRQTKVALSVKIELTSSDFAPGAPIPRECSGEGQDRSPQLLWGAFPPETRELALVCDDPDAPTPRPWVHWVIYGLEPTMRSLPAGIPVTATLVDPVKAKQGKNSWTDGQTIGYRGPMPPPGHGIHHYHFKLYALDTSLDLTAGADKAQLLEAMQGHIIAQGELIGTYQR